MSKNVEFNLKHDIARLSRAAGLIEKVLENVDEVETDHIAVPLKLYCSKFEIETCKNILEHILNDYQEKQTSERQLE